MKTNYAIVDVTKAVTLNDKNVPVSTPTPNAVIVGKVVITKSGNSYFKGVAMTTPNVIETKNDACKVVICAQIAEIKHAKTLESDYKTIDGKMTSIFAGSLNTTLFFTTDSEGNINNAFASEVTLNRTHLKVRANDKVCEVGAKHRKSIIKALINIACNDFAKYTNVSGAFARLMTESEKETKEAIKATKDTKDTKGTKKK